MSYGLNVEMHRQSELAKRYLAICHQLIPCLSQEVEKKTKSRMLKKNKQIFSFSNKIKSLQHSNEQNK